MIALKLLEYSFCVFLKERFLGFHVLTKNLETFENASIRFNVVARKRSFSKTLSP